MEIVPIDKARALGLKRYYPGPCPKGHESERYVSNTFCIKCTAERIAYRKLHPNAVDGRRKIKRAAKPEPVDKPPPELVGEGFTWNTASRQRLVDAFVDTGDLASAREIVGVTPSEYHRELARNETFRDDMKAATALAIQTLEEVAIRGARKGNERLIIAVLKAKFPEQYSEKIKVDNTHNHTVRLSDDELDKRIARYTRGLTFEQGQGGIARLVGGTREEGTSEQDGRRYTRMTASMLDTSILNTSSSSPSPAKYNEIALFGGNRSGKTVAGCYADTVHATGLYPEWWRGYRFDRPTDGWVAGDTAKTVRDILQRELLGKPSDAAAILGTGMIPAHTILRTAPKHGLADAFESVSVKHVSGGTSVIHFKSYDQGRDAFQGTSQDWVHLDEDCAQDIYAECLLRLLTTKGILYWTATLVEGITPLMLRLSAAPTTYAG